MTSRSSIFGTDGIRAVAGEFPLTPEFVRRIGLVAGAFFRREENRKKKPARQPAASRRFLLGRDTRESGNWIEKKLWEGLNQSGCKVFSCRVIPTSAVAAILRKEKFMGGAVISASHNPAEFNGIKFFSSAGAKISDRWEKEIEGELSKKPESNRLPRSGSVRFFPQGLTLYTQFLKESLPRAFSLQGLRWVVDCAQGAQSAIAPAILKSLGAEVVAIHDSPDGKNINRNCGALHPESLQKVVRRFRADGGCAFDGDADRVQFVDEKGNLQDGDILLALLADTMKKNRQLRNNLVVTTVMANFGFMQAMKKRGIRVLTTAVGDRAVSDALESSRASLGGEQSGHIIFRELLPTGDGLLTALKVLSCLRSSGKKLSFFSKMVPKFPQLLTNLKVREKIPLNDCPELRRTIRELAARLDGRGRILVRYSGTEPLLRIMVEAETLTEVKRVSGQILGVARNVFSS